MEDGDWAGLRTLGMYLNGDGIAGRDRQGQPIRDDHFLILLNGDGDQDVTLPDEEYAAAWQVVLDTSGRLRPGQEGSPRERSSRCRTAASSC
ncbi:hypothetical protein [Nocardioides convexus]|uniref:hypothetical protein n=1 Tax=Nocardioides convexus TaxID=2712224 RepID=UPI0024182AD1|nr:hypothetical protein [Nocardioides convexus]